jgi:hypothetical protein
VGLLLLMLASSSAQIKVAKSIELKFLPFFAHVFITQDHHHHRFFLRRQNLYH